MNSLHICTLFGLIAFASASGWIVDPWHQPAHVPHKYVEPAPLDHEGRVVDTPEVEKLKAEHFAAHAKAKAALSVHWALPEKHWAPAPAPEAWAPKYWAPAPAKAHWAPAPVEHKWTGPLAHIELTHDGKYVKDTPEVEHARAEHLAAYAAVAAKAKPYYLHEAPAPLWW